MFYVLYDKDFNALGTRKTYPCSSWSLKRKANEFNEMTIEGMEIDSYLGANYVGLHDNDGTLKHIALSGIPVTKKGKTVINSIDIRQLLNNDCVIDLTSVTTVKALYNELLNCLFTGTYKYINLGLVIDAPDLAETESISFINNSVELKKDVGNVWETIQAANSIYDCYVDTIVNYITKKIKFVVKRIINVKSIKLEDFGHPKIVNDGTGINRVVCYNSTYTAKETYYLLNDDTVVYEPNVPPSKILYPINVKVFVEDTISDARVKGIQELYKNRFKQNVEITNDESSMWYLLDGIDLTYKADIYNFKVLPVMEIDEDHKGNKKIKFGRLEEFWWL